MNKKFYHVLFILLALAVIFGAAQCEKPCLCNAEMLICGEDEGESSCPCYTGETFGYNGDHLSGTNYACDSEQGNINGTDYGLDYRGADYVGFDAPDEYISFPVDSSEIDSGGAYTIWFTLEIDEVASTVPFEYAFNGVNYIAAKVVNGYLQVHFMIGGVLEYDQAGPLSADTPTACAISFDTPNNDIAVYVGGWAEDTDATDIGDLGVNEPNTVVLGEQKTSSTVNTATKVKDVVIKTGYKTADPR